MNTQVVLVGLYTYFNVPVRILHPLADRIKGVDAHTIFYKNYDSNIFSLPNIKEEEIFIDTIKQLNPKIVTISLLAPLMIDILAFQMDYESFLKSIKYRMIYEKELIQ